MLYDGIVLLAFMLISSTLWLPIGFGHPLYGLYRAFLLLVVFLYFAWCWTHGGQTVGMKVWHFRLIRNNGGRVRWPQSASRFVGALLSAVVLGLGYLWILFSRDRKSWHDMLSDTRLVMNKNEMS